MPNATGEQILLLTDYLEDVLGEIDDTDEQPFGERAQVERDATNRLVVRHEDGQSAVSIVVQPLSDDEL